MECFAGRPVGEDARFPAAHVNSRLMEQSVGWELGERYCSAGAAGWFQADAEV